MLVFIEKPLITIFLPSFSPIFIISPKRSIKEAKVPTKSRPSAFLKIFSNYHFETEVLVASIRHPHHVTKAALLGAHIATMPYDVFSKLILHPLTDSGLKKFLADWKKTKL